MEILLPVIIVAVIALIAGLGLSIASKVFAVPTDEKQEKVRAALPGANCGSCGYSGCDGYAEAICNGTASPDKCAPGGAGTAAALSEILGVEISAEPKVAHVYCVGGNGYSDKKMAYSGIQSCTAAASLYRGPKVCTYGCIGFGDCVKACTFGAISIKNGVAVVDTEKCSGCGNCVNACPKGSVRLIPKDYKVTVDCSNTEKGAKAMKVCTVSCIGCMKCVKTCEQDAIYVEDFLARIDDKNCIGCGKCIEACPRHCISPVYCEK